MDHRPLDQSAWKRGWKAIEQLFGNPVFVAAHVGMGVIVSVVVALVQSSDPAPPLAEQAGIALGAGIGAYLVLILLLWLAASGVAPVHQRNEARALLATPSLDLRVETEGARTFLVQSAPPWFGGWLYIAVLNITNREPRGVVLAVDAVLRLVNINGGVTKARSPASRLSPPDLSHWFGEVGPIPEIARIERLPPWIDIDPDKAVTGYIAILLKDHQIPRESADFMGKADLLSDVAPDSDVLVIDDLVSDRRLRMDWDAFRGQAFEKRKRRLFGHATALSKSKD